MILRRCFLRSVSTLFCGPMLARQIGENRGVLSPPRRVESMSITVAPLCVPHYRNSHENLPAR